MAAGEAFYHDKGPLRLRVEVVEAEGIPCVSRSSGSTCAVHVKIGPLVTHTRPMAVSHTTVTWNEVGARVSFHKHTPFDSLRCSLLYLTFRRKTVTHHLPFLLPIQFALSLRRWLLCTFR